MKKSLLNIFIGILSFYPLKANLALAENNQLPPDFMNGLRLPHTKKDVHSMLNMAEEGGAKGCAKWLYPSRPEMGDEISGDEDVRGDSARLQCAQLAHSAAVDKKDDKAKSVIESSIDPTLLQ